MRKLTISLMAVLSNLLLLLGIIAFAHGQYQYGNGLSTQYHGHPDNPLDCAPNSPEPSGPPVQVCFDLRYIPLISPNFEDLLSQIIRQPVPGYLAMSLKKPELSQGQIVRHGARTRGDTLHLKIGDGLDVAIEDGIAIGMNANPRNDTSVGKHKKVPNRKGGAKGGRVKYWINRIRNAKRNQLAAKLGRKIDMPKFDTPINISSVERGNIVNEKEATSGSGEDVNLSEIPMTISRKIIIPIGRDDGQIVTAIGRFANRGKSTLVKSPTTTAEEIASMESETIDPNIVGEQSTTTPI